MMGMVTMKMKIMLSPSSSHDLEEHQMLLLGRVNEV